MHTEEEILEWRFQTSNRSLEYRSILPSDCETTDLGPRQRQRQRQRQRGSGCDGDADFAMDFELKKAKEKWEREQKQRKLEAKARLDREKKAKEEAARLQEALESAQRFRRLEEAQAAAQARLQEESDLHLGDGIRFNVVLQSTFAAREGDKINLPPSAFESLSSQGALDKGPMFFEISLDTESVINEANERSTHSGVLQFTAPEGCAELPPHVWKNAGIAGTPPAGSLGPLIRIRYVRLPKCSYAKLQPETAEFADVPNHKAVLETKLRQHATLSEGDVLVVQHGGIDYSLHVLELKPSSNVSVLETDMEVDVIPAAASSESQSGRLVPLQIGKFENGCVEEGSYKYFKFGLDEKLCDAANNGDIDVNVQLEIEGGGTRNDADLYVAAHPVLFPTQHEHQWASHDIGSKTIHLTSAQKKLSAGSYSIGVFGYQGNSSFKISVSTQPPARNNMQRLNAPSASDSEVQAGLEICGNCRQAIPGRTIALHEAYCRRHNIVCDHPGCGVVLRLQEHKKHAHCPKCGQSLQSEELPKHLKVYHEPQFCRCGAVFERDEMVKHQKDSCPLRTIMCRFCGDMVQAGAGVDNIRDKLNGLTQHESICGSRTAPCELCGRAVMLKEMDLHKIAAHDPRPSLDVAHQTPRFGSSDGSPDAPFTTSLAQAKHAGSPIISQCPICSMTFEGEAVEAQLNAHLDREHFTDSTPQEHVPEIANSLNSSYRSSLSIACPICGLAVHSERDLSLHIDMVH